VGYDQHGVGALFLEIARGFRLDVMERSHRLVHLAAGLFGHRFGRVDRPRYRRCGDARLTRHVSDRWSFQVPSLPPGRMWPRFFFTPVAGKAKHRCVRAGLQACRCHNRRAIMATMLSRLVLAIALFATVSGPLQAMDWTRYVNARFGMGVDIPADFSVEGAAAVEGDGKRFRARNGRATITAWGAPARDADFMAETGARIAAEEAAGWAITYRSETPDWAAWGGTRGGHVFYAKAILVC